MMFALIDVQAISHVPDTGKTRIWFLKAYVAASVLDNNKALRKELPPEFRAVVKGIRYRLKRIKHQEGRYRIDVARIL
jgi:hypothetical protein